MEEFPTLDVHENVEEVFKEQESSLLGDTTPPWVVPPAETHKRMKAFLANRKARRNTLSDAEQHWFDRRGDARAGSTALLVEEGKTLYDAMIWAHRGHKNVPDTMRDFAKKYVCPKRKFFELWVARCPACNGRRRRNRGGGSRDDNDA